MSHSLSQFPDLRWIVFAGPEQPWAVTDPRIEVVRTFPANNRGISRLWADHFKVAPEARARGAAGLLTVGFGPMRTADLPIVMQVFSVHHLNGWGLRSLYRRFALGRGIRDASLVIANSEWTAGRLRAAYPQARGLLVSHEGIQRDRFKADGEAGAAGLPPSYLLWAGNFYRYKRAECVLEAYSRLPEGIRAGFPLLLAGGDWNAGRKRAEARARSLGIESSVRFLGWVPDAGLPALYRGARAHVMASSEETFGRSVLEAMACGCPSVLQDLPVLREVTAGAGIFTDFENPDAAAREMERLCMDDVLHDRLRSEGMRRAGDFSFERLARERVGAIMSVLNR